MSVACAVALPEAWRVELMTRPRFRRQVLSSLASVPGVHLLDWGDHLEPGKPVVLASQDLSLAELLLKLPEDSPTVVIDNPIAPSGWPLGAAARFLARARRRPARRARPSRPTETLPDDLLGHLAPALDLVRDQPAAFPAGGGARSVDNAQQPWKPPADGLTVAMIGHAGNSITVRGGLEVLLDELAEALLRRGVRVARRIDEAGAAPDLLHFFGAFYGLGGAWAAADDFPRVLSPVLLRSDAASLPWRQLIDPLRSRLPGSLLLPRRRMLREADLVVASSREEATSARRLGARAVERVLGGVDGRHLAQTPPTLDRLPGAWRQRAHNWQRHRQKVVSIGRFERRKNQLEVAKACRQLGVSVLLIGRHSPVEPDYLGLLEAIAGGDVALWVDAPREARDWALAVSDVHVLATRHETIGLASLEAAVSGCRPVAIDQPTSREYLLPFGVLATSPSPTDLGVAIQQALARGRLEQEERGELAELSWDAMAERLEALYREVLSRRRSQARGVVE